MRVQQVHPGDSVATVTHPWVSPLELVQGFSAHFLLCLIVGPLLRIRLNNIPGMCLEGQLIVLRSKGKGRKSTRVN